ncbi:MAG TPA: hypothetical protein PK156_47270 [Polyangium sp.]|nr:hypothetical protein [Polyangium sp.]
MTPEESTAEEVSPNKPSVVLPRRRSRLSTLLIVAGAVLGLAPLTRIWPHDHQIDFRFEGARSDVTRFDVEWTRADDLGSGEVLTGSSRSSEPAQAPEIVNMNVHLPNGSYVLDIRIEHADRLDTIQHRITLGEADRIAVPLRADRLRP